MKAMVLAAGLGTRLRPLTNDRPKALVELAGKSLLEITLGRLRSFGIQDVIVNVHHFAGLIEEYLETHRNFGMHIAISREETLLDTGGGLKKAAWFFDDDEPFVLHNVDVISNIDLKRLREFHVERNALATLAVQNRDTSRYLLFDSDLHLRGRKPVRDPDFLSLGFSGIHVISPRLLRLLEEGSFSIVSSYLDLAARGEAILGFLADEYYWRDLGKPEDLAQAAGEYVSSHDNH
jgi:NDP-sugar pyrophosphorylase family protein